MQIWLQRATIKLPSIYSYITFDEQICKEADKIYKNEKSKFNLWNIEWLNNKKLKNAMNKYPIICKKDIDEIAEYTNVDEVSVFENHSL